MYEHFIYIIRFIHKRNIVFKIGMTSNLNARMAVHRLKFGDIETVRISRFNYLWIDWAEDVLLKTFASKRYRGHIYRELFLFDDLELKQCLELVSNLEEDYKKYYISQKDIRSPYQIPECRARLIVG